MSKYSLLQNPESFIEKSLIMEKKIERDPLGFFNIHSVAKLQKIKGGTLWGKFFPNKNLAMPKKTKRGDTWVSSGIVCYARNLFGSVSWANRGNLKFCRTFGRTILVRSGVTKKTLTKSHDYSRLFSVEKRRLKLIIFKSLTMSKKVKGGSFRLFKHPFCCKITRKLKGAFTDI